MAMSDLRKLQSNFNCSVEEARIVFRLQTKILNTRADMLTKYRRDLKYRAFQPNPSTWMEGQDVIPTVAPWSCTTSYNLRVGGRVGGRQGAGGGIVEEYSKCKLSSRTLIYIKKALDESNKKLLKFGSF